MKKSYFQIFPLIALIITACLLILWSTFSQSIRLDESQSIWVATKSLTAILRLIALDVHVPLYAILLHFWMQIFGSTIIAARILSFIFFLLTLPVLFILSREHSNSRVALLTVALFSLSPFIIWYSSEARMYTLFTLIASINQLFFLRIIKSEGKSGKMGYFTSLVLGFYTHYFFSFLVISQFLYIICTIILKIILVYTTQKQSFWKKLKRQRLLFTFFPILFSAGLVFSPWLIFVIIGGAASNTQPLIPPPTSYNLVQVIINFIFGFQTYGIQSLLVSLWPLAVVLLFLVFTRRKNFEFFYIGYFILATFLPIILVFLFSYFRPIFLSRYLILVTPTLFFLIALTLSNFSKRFTGIILSIFLILLLGLSVYQNASVANPAREDYQSVASYLENQAKPKDVIAVSAPFTIYPIEYSYRGNSRIVTIPEWNRYEEGSIPSFSLNNLKNQISVYQKQYERIFLVLSYNQGYQKDIQNYFDYNYRLNEKKKFLPNLEVRIYQLRYDIEQSK